MAFRKNKMKINYSKIAKRILSKYYKAKTSHIKQTPNNPKNTSNTKANNNNNYN